MTEVPEVIKSERLSRISPHALCRLPLELILEITDKLPPEAFINFAFAYYPLLRSHGLVPAMSVRQLSELVDRSRIPSLFRLVPLPTELLLKTIRLLNPLDTMRFVLANYHDLAHSGIAPPLTQSTIQSLQSACWDEQDLD